MHNNEELNPEMEAALTQDLNDLVKEYGLENVRAILGKIDDEPDELQEPQPHTDEIDNKNLRAESDEIIEKINREFELNEQQQMWLGTLKALFQFRKRLKNGDSPTAGEIVSLVLGDIAPKDGGQVAEIINEAAELPRQEIRSILPSFGFKIVSPRPGNEFDPNYQSSAGVIPTDNPMHKNRATIAEVVHEGLVYDNNKVDTPAKVKLWKYEEK